MEKGVDGAHMDTILTSLRQCPCASKALDANFSHISTYPVYGDWGTLVRAETSAVPLSEDAPTYNLLQLFSAVTMKLERDQHFH